MTTSIDDVCDWAAAALKSIPGLKAKGYIDDDVHPPEAQIFTREHDPRFVFQSDLRRLPFGVLLLVPRTSPRAGQKKLREYLEPSGGLSVKEALEDTANWPAGVHYVEVTLNGPVLETEVAGHAYLGVNVEFDVLF